MRADEIRDVFERLDAEPSSEFSETLLARLCAPTRCISIVEPGAEPPATASELRVQPLSPGDLEQLYNLIEQLL